jgi:hypothetical protein
MGKFGLSGPSQAVLGHLRLFGSSVVPFQTITAPGDGRFGPIQAISACFEPGKNSFRPTRSRCGLFWANIGPLQVILGHSGSFRIVFGHFTPQKAKKGMFLEASDCFGPLGRTVSGHPKAIKGHLGAV